MIMTQLYMEHGGGATHPAACLEGLAWALRWDRLSMNKPLPSGQAGRGCRHGQDCLRSHGSVMTDAAAPASREIQLNGTCAASNHGH